MPSSGAARALLDVRLTPRASRAGIEVAGGLVRVRVTAPAVEGRANAALVELLAKRLGVAKRDVTITRGHTSRSKRVAIEGLSVADALERLAGA
jgi:uncharacterized protein (TIGR00251 family)